MCVCVTKMTQLIHDTDKYLRISIYKNKNTDIGRVSTCKICITMVDFGDIIPLSILENIAHEENSLVYLNVLSSFNWDPFY